MQCAGGEKGSNGSGSSLRRMEKPCYDGQADDVDNLRKNIAAALEADIPEIAAVKFQEVCKVHFVTASQFTMRFTIWSL